MSVFHPDYVSFTKGFDGTSDGMPVNAEALRKLGFRWEPLSCGNNAFDNIALEFCLHLAPKWQCPRPVYGSWVEWRQSLPHHVTPSKHR